MAVRVAAVVAIVLLGLGALPGAQSPAATRATRRLRAEQVWKDFERLASPNSKGAEPGRKAIARRGS